MIIMVILVFFMVISVNRRLFRYFGSYSGISVIPVILVNRRTAREMKNGRLWKKESKTCPCYNQIILLHQPCYIQVQVYFVCS